MKNNNTNKKFIVIIVILSVLVLAAGGTLAYFLIENAKAEQLAKEKAEQTATYEQALIKTIEEAVVLCPEVLEYIGENEVSYKFFIENINSSTDIYDRATNANSLVKTTAFYYNQAIAGDIEAIEAGEEVEPILTPELEEYREKLTQLRNNFNTNWYGFLGKSDLISSNQEDTQEVVTE